MVCLRDIFSSDEERKITLPSLRDEGFKFSFAIKEKVVIDAVVPVYEDQKAPPLPFSATETHAAPVISARVLSAQQDGFKPVYQLSFDVSGTSISNKFHPGDTIGVIPSSDSKDVALLLKCMDLYSEADVPYLLENSGCKGKSQIPKHVPVKSTLRYTFTHCVELRAVVKKLFLRALSSFCDAELDRRCLEFMCSKEGSQLYTEYILNKNITLLDILQSFPSCRPSVVCVLSNLPRLLPRPYSVVNSRLSGENVVTMCFSVATLTKGLTTGWLEEIAIENSTHKGLSDVFNKLTIGENTRKVPIYLRKNMSFSFPNETAKVLMVGPGTGVAPYMGFLEERKLLKKRNPSMKLGETWLFFGCRNSDIDYIYKEEIQGYLKEKILSRLSTSFSREDNNGIKYVQDAIKQNGKEVAQFIEDGALLYVCGDLSAMAKQVEDAFIQCLQLHTARTYEQCVVFVKNMQKNKKYFVDVWS